jgi:hypothetical protein
MPWKCSGCGEQIEDTFETCWNCGRDYDGHPAEEVADDALGSQADVPNGAAPQVSEAAAAAEADVDTVSGPLKIPNLPGEHLLVDLHDGDFILTTRRRRHRSERIGASSLVSIYARRTSVMLALTSNQAVATRCNTCMSCRRDSDYRQEG